MITKIDEKRQAIELRKSGLSYNEIRQKVNVAKSTLSLWLRSVGMAKRQIRRITEKQREAQRKAVKVIHERRISKTLKIKDVAAKEIGLLSERERWLMGICLYWAEGAKEKNKGALVKFSNSDPFMIRLFREWALDFLKVGPEDMIYNLYIHEKSKNIPEAVRFWSDFLGIDPYEMRIILKKHNPSPKRKNIGVDYKGLINLSVRRSIDTNRLISGWIDGIIRESEIIGE